MKRTGVSLLLVEATAAAISALAVHAAIGSPSVPDARNRPASITIDYPQDGSIFPPEITPPTFLWRDPTSEATRWRIDVVFGSGAPALHAESSGERLKIGEIDERCFSPTNKLPELTPEQAAAHTWIPDEAAWAQIKRNSEAAPATILIRGFSEKSPKQAISQGKITIQTSKDPVGAPIFYRDVPLMPSETEKGVIKPLAPEAIRLIQWRLRDLSKPTSRVVLANMPTCANCHSFSLDGKTMGMDMDGPANDKGLYALAPLKPVTTIGVKDMVNWNAAGDRQVGLNRVGFMSQVSPDGKCVLTTVSSIDRPPQMNFYVVNFKDYRFLQVFYPTRGVLAWYSRETGRREPLPGADDPRYVQTDGVWSPDGKYIVFARAEAKEPYPPDGRMAEYANDPIEVQVQYDLYRVPFNDGRGGRPEPIAGASANGMSNTFPKVSPDGKWIVFVQNQNGQLMRPDSQLYIVPAEGGKARRMRCNTRLMNSWHSFSPNGRWLVFASKSRSPYTQMYLTHIDEQGNDSPAILVDNATAANRAVNLPEFVNISPDGLLKIETPAVEVYRQFDLAVAMSDKGQYADAIALWRKLLADDPDDARMLNNLGAALAKTGRLDEAIQNYQRALKLNPLLVPAKTNLASALLAAGRVDDAIPRLREAVELHPESAELHNSLGRALAMKRQLADAVAEFAKAVEIKPNYVEALYYLGLSVYYLPGGAEKALEHWRQALKVDPNCMPALDSVAHVLATSPDAAVRNGAEAVALAEHAVQLSGGKNPAYLDTLAAAYAEAGRFPKAVETARRAMDLASRQNQPELVQELTAKVRLYEAGTPFREAPEAATP